MDSDYPNNDDDYSPEEAYRRFPTNQRFNSNPQTNNKHNAHFNNPPPGRITPDDILDIMSNKDSSASDATLDLTADSIASGSWNITNSLNNTFKHRFITPPEVRGGSDDGIVLPVLFSSIGLCAIVGNVIVLLAFLGFRRMRSGQNLMLANIAVADILFVLATVPAAVLNHASAPGSGVVTPPQLCRFVHYVIFVGVYVSIYTLVVTCVFRFFGEFMRGGNTPSVSATQRNGTIFSTSAAGSRRAAAPSLTLGNAALSCAVIWIAFMTSHVNFLIQSEGAIFDEPFVCEHYDGPMEAAKLRTLWVTFISCACLLPLLIICTLSALILRNGKPITKLTPPLQIRSGHRLANSGHSGRPGSYHQRPHGAKHEFEEESNSGGLAENRFYAQETEEINGYCSSGNGYDREFRNTTKDDGISCRPSRGATVEYETAQNSVNESRSLRDLTVAVMAATIVRCLCWLPIQIFVLFDIFASGTGGGPQGQIGDTVAYRKAELAAVCFGFAATCVNPLVYQCACAEFRRAYAGVFARCCRCLVAEKGDTQVVAVVPPAELYGRQAGRRVGGETNMTILSIISDSSNRINYI